MAEAIDTEIVAAEDLAQQHSCGGVQVPAGCMDGFRSSLESGAYPACYGKVQDDDTEAVNHLPFLPRFLAPYESKSPQTTRGFGQRTLL